MSNEIKITALLLTVTLLLLCACERYSQSGTGQSSLDRRVLFDFRTQIQPTTTEASTTQKLEALKAANAANQNQANPQVECTAKQAAASVVLGSLSGPFTAPKTTEAAYLLSDPCAASTLAGNALVVFRNDRIVAAVHVDADRMLTAKDVDKDDQDEILLGQVGFSGGITKQSATLIRLEGNKLRKLEDFGGMREDTCNSPVVSKAINAMVLSYLPASSEAKTHYSVEAYRAECPQRGELPVFVRNAGK